ncbi:hypothetical protein KCP77_22125 [Salmonella enterica subsp. enterica]|nr:hypothetical protein KCP77_22125 [Salmonella enterica subsp. enterica]
MKRANEVSSPYHHRLKEVYARWQNRFKSKRRQHRFLEPEPASWICPPKTQPPSRLTTRSAVRKALLKKAARCRFPANWRRHSGRPAGAKGGQDGRKMYPYCR